VKRLSLALSVALALFGGRVEVGAQQPPPRADAVRQLLQRLEQIAQGGDADGYLRLLAGSADRDRAIDFGSTEFQPGATRAVVLEGDRQPLGGTPEGDGYRIIAQAFVEYGARARFTTWRIDVERIGDDWRIADEERLTAVENLYRLSLNATKQFDAHDVRITVEDLDLTLATGSVFVADTDHGVTGLVLLGRGDMRFHPTPETEKGQVKIFCGAETLETRFDAAFLRINPGDFDRLIAADHLTSRAVVSRELRRADEVFRDEAPKSYGLELGDFSGESWSLLPEGGDFLAEIRTRRFDTLTYARSSTQPEDVNLFQRKKRRNIALYASEQKLAGRGRFYNEDDLAEYDILDYNIDLTVSPDRQWLDGRARVLLKVRAFEINTITLRLADSLAVRSIASDELGGLFAIRLKEQNSVLVKLPTPVRHDTVLTLTVVYAGRREPQSEDRETLALQRGSASQGEDARLVAEPSFLYSNRSYWYPQATVTDYATARLRITVPATLDCVASGDLEPGSPTLVAAGDGAPARKVYVFSATQPLRYLAFVVSRFVRSETVTVPLTYPPPQADEVREGTPARSGAYYSSLDVTVAANPRQASVSRDLMERSADIARFYASLVGDCPYPSFTIALLENDLPGGHSPGYFAALNQTLPTSPLVWRNDPAAFSDYEDFFLAHELAHQWWGQAIGWRNYHEQWLSEAFAQYFAALYADRHRGADVFAGVMRQMRKWGMDESDQGPVYLGYRLGHIRGEGKVFRALVYDKGAVVLHMLRRLVGDAAFFRGVRRFYRTSRFSKAGTEDFRLALEAESGVELERFFEQWIYGSTLPRVKFSHRVEGSDVVLHVEQVGELFDLPLTVTLQYADKKRVDIVVPVKERTVDLRVALAGTLRRVDVSKDDGTMAEIVKN